MTVTGPTGSMALTLNDFCANRTRLLDLSDEAFRAVCGPVRRGTCEVAVRP